MLMDSIPKTNENITTKNIPKTFTLICKVNNFMPSYTALAIIIGILIKNEKSNASCLSKPINSPQTKVEPLRDMPGNIARPCASPIYRALDLFIYLFFVFTKSAMTSAIAEIKNPQTRVLIEKLSSIYLLNNKTIITVGIVAIIKFKFVLFNG